MAKVLANDALQKLISSIVCSTMHCTLERIQLGELLDSHEELRRLLRVLWLAFPMSLEPKLSPEDKAAISEAVGEE